MTLSRTRHLPKISSLHQNESSSAVQQRCSSVSVRSFSPASKNQVETSSGCRQGAISQQTSPLPSESLSYPSPTQDPVAPPKHVVVGRTAALRLRLCYCLTTASKNLRSTCKMKNDKILDLDSYYHNRVLRWAGHVARMPMNRATRQLLTG